MIWWLFSVILVIDGVAYNATSSPSTKRDDPGIILPQGTQGACDFSQGTSFSVQSQSTQPSVAQLTDGSLVVVSQVNGKDGSGLGIFGTVKDKEFQVNSIVVFDQKNAQTAALPTGGFVVVYESTVALLAGQSFPREQRILFQIFYQDGTALGVENSVNLSDGSRQDTVPSVAANQDGFVITWISQVLVDNDSQTGQLVARGFGFDGAALGDVFLVNSIGDQATSPQNIQRMSDGNFIVVWSSKFGCGASSIMARKLSLSSVVGPQFQVGLLSTFNQLDPFVTTHDDGIVVAWSNTTQYGNTVIVFQSFDNQLTPLTAPVIAQENNVAFQSQPFVVAFNNTTAILWNQFIQSTGKVTVQGALYTVDGVYLQDITLQPVSKPNAVQTTPVAQILNGTLTVVWIEDGSSTVGRHFQCSQNCQVSEWSEFTECTVVCGGGTQNRSRTITQEPQLGGQVCPQLIETQQCNTQACVEPICSQCINAKCFTVQPGDRSICSLADIQDSNERSFVVNKVLQGSQLYWINTWQGSNYSGLCLSISQFGAITVPLGGCAASSVTAALCQVPQPETC